MRKPKFKGLIIADFNAQNLAGYLNNDEEAPSVEVTMAPFGQVAPQLIDKDPHYWTPDLDFAIVWTQPEAVVGSFGRMLDHRKASLDQVLDEVDDYVSQLLAARDRVRHLFVPTWEIPVYRRDFGIFDWAAETGVSNVLMRMNLRLADRLAQATNVYLLNTRQWTCMAGKHAFQTQLWYMAKVPFSNEVFAEAVRDVKAALMGLTGQAKKLIVLDLDDTIWGGIVGEVGWQNLRLGGHDHVGEAYLDFQRALKALTRRGIVLGIVSKNDEVTAMEAIRRHPAMILKVEDFAGWEINWLDKAQNLAKLVARLNLGIESVVFIDDSPAERARVKGALPQVLVPEWPNDPMLYTSTLFGLRCFYAGSLHKEDLDRTQMYDHEKRRNELKCQVNSFDEWLHTLQLEVAIERLSRQNLLRATQLLNKTNQMNLATRRMTESDLMAWAGQNRHTLWIFSVRDRFGDSGLTGIASLEVTERRGRIVDFLLSCRVMGRKIEETMLYTVIQHARSLGLDEVCAEYVPTARNEPCLAFFKQSGFHGGPEEHMFVWRLRDDYKLPRHVKIVAGAPSPLNSMDHV